MRKGENRGRKKSRKSEEKIIEVKNEKTKK